MRVLQPLLLGIATLCLVGCPSAHQATKSDPGLAPCLKPTQHDLVVQWGDYEQHGQPQWVGYELAPNSAVYRIDSSGQETGATRTLIGYIGHEEYCKTVDFVSSMFLKVQALHSPGTKARFIQYTNRASAVYLRAMWNPELSTFQSRDMRALYDKLNGMVPSLGNNE